MATSKAARNPGQSAYGADKQKSGLPAPVGRQMLREAYLQSNGPVRRCHHRHPTTLASIRDGFCERPASVRTSAESHKTVPQTASRSPAKRPFVLRVRLHHMEHCQTKHPFAGCNRHQNLQRLVATTGSFRGLCLPSAQAYFEGQTQRASVSQGSEQAQAAQKRALGPEADYELWYLDESEFHLHPHLTRAWMPKGSQKRVHSPGVNRKQTVFGAFCYGRGSFYYHIQPRKTAWGVRILLAKLVKRVRRTGRRIIVVMDQGNPHHAGSVRQYLADVKEHVEVFWLPHYSPELNLIEPLWKYLKQTRMANVLFPSFKQFTGHLTEALADFASHPDFTLSVATPNSRKICRKKLLVAT